MMSPATLLLLPLLALAGPAPDGPSPPRAPLSPLPLHAEGPLPEAEPGAIDRYDCVPEIELPGPERTWRLELETPGLLRLALDADAARGAQVLLLREPEISDGGATGCVAASSDVLRVAGLEAGPYLVVVDSATAAPAEPLPFTVHAEHLPADSWAEHSIEPGLTWSRRWSPDGPQAVSVLRVEPALRDRVAVRRHEGCETVAAVGEREGALAGINAAFFSKRCEPLCLLADGGETIAVTAMGKGAQRAMGWRAGEPVQWAWIDEGASWPDVDLAVAGYPSLVSEGVASIEPSDDSSFQASTHPRTAVGVTADGTLLMVAVDGRTAMGAGATIPELAALMVELGAVDAVNLDGGGSTTLWVEGAWLGGVVNHPSDDGQPGHAGSRAVSDGLYVLPSPSSERSTRGGEGSSEKSTR